MNDDLEWPAVPGENDPDLLHTFVRHTIVSVVRPVAEQVRELQAKVCGLAVGLGSVDSKAASNTEKVSRLEEEVGASRVAAAKTGAALEKAQIGVARSEDELARLIADHDKTKKAVVEVGDVQAGLVDNVKALNVRTADIEGQLRSLALGLWKADKNIESLNEGLSRMKEAHMEVRDKASEQSKEMATLSRGAEELERELMNLHKFLDQNKLDDKKHIERLDSHIADVERAADLAHRGIEEPRDEAKAMSSDLHRLHDSVEHKDGSETGVDQLRTVQNELLTKVAAHQKHFDRLEECVDRLGGSFCEEKQKTDRAISDLSLRLESSITDLRALDKMARSTRDEMPRQANAVHEHQAMLHKVLDQVATNRDEMRQVASWQKAAASLVESHTLQLQQLRDEGDSGDRRLNQVDEACRLLQKDVGRIGDVVGSLSRRFDKSVSSFGGRPVHDARNPQSPAQSRPSTGAPPSAGLLEAALPGLRATGRPLTARNRSDITASSSAWMA